MEITVNINDIKPVYEQIVYQVEQAVKDGRLSPGALLPPIRQLAVDLDINPNTVAKAYQILETHRVIRTAGRRGTFVNEGARDHAQLKSEQNAVAKMTDVISMLKANGLNPDDIKQAFNQALKTMT